MEEITFEQAKNYVLKFGPEEFRMKKLDDIARKNSGLRYLDKIVGYEWVHEETKKHIKRYLSEDVIKRDLEKLV